MIPVKNAIQVVLLVKESLIKIVLLVLILFFFIALLVKELALLNSIQTLTSIDANLAMIPIASIADSRINAQNVNHHIFYIKTHAIRINALKELLPIIQAKTQLALTVPKIVLLALVETQMNALFVSKIYLLD
jgi:Na+-transporting NADH:ubiquinone oxidoreductase subunit NqrC